LREYQTGNLDDAFEDGYDFAIRQIEAIPAADVRPVVRGKWIKPTRVPDSMLSECSVCGFDTGAYTFNFCPNCGADMRETK
jgi:hypothetical protein